MEQCTLSEGSPEGSSPEASPKVTQKTKDNKVDVYVKVVSSKYKPAEVATDDVPFEAYLKFCLKTPASKLRNVLLNMEQIPRIQEELKNDPVLNVGHGQEMIWEYHYLAFHSIWQRFSILGAPGQSCQSGLMFHSRAMMNIGMHTTLSNYCRALFFESANELPRAYEHICRVLDTLPEGDYLLELWAIGRSALHLACGGLGPVIPLKRISSLLRRFDHVLGCLDGHPYSDMLPAGGSVPFPAWPPPTGLRTLKHDLLGLRCRISALSPSSPKGQWHVPGKTPQSMSMPHLQCSSCNSINPVLSDMKACVCRKAWYCNRLCQINHRPHHKEMCKANQPAQHCCDT
ncbi:hypothetical protein WJX74_003380 [Apatococcus lobatus]|uniref:MYND-type domain-containing protein n=1 Tax=Apatococcus lobatus TaxID=904363 RepID=A0AAW1QUR9_9CHLO